MHVPVLLKNILCYKEAFRMRFKLIRWIAGSSKSDGHLFEPLRWIAGLNLADESLVGTNQMDRWFEPIRWIDGWNQSDGSLV